MVPVPGLVEAVFQIHPAKKEEKKNLSWRITKYKHFRPLLLRPHSPLINQHTERKLHSLLNILSQPVS